MRYADILSIFESNQNPSSWIRVSSESGDGSVTIYCREDVLLVITFQFIARQGKIIARLQFGYGSTSLAWVHIELASHTTPETEYILREIKSIVS